MMSPRNLHPGGASNGTESAVSHQLACGIDDDNGGVCGGRGIYDVYERSETTTEAARIQGRRRRLGRFNDGLEELATMTDASAEEDDPED